MKNFLVPAEFIFRPYSADWRIAWAETVEWIDDSVYKSSSLLTSPPPGSLRVRIDLEDRGTRSRSSGIRSYRTVALDPLSLPPDVMQPHENHRKTPDISGRQFKVLICQASVSGDNKADPKKMRDEFLQIYAKPESAWVENVCQFLNKWGLWDSDRGFMEDCAPGEPTQNVFGRTGGFYALPSLKNTSAQERNTPTRMKHLIVPHLLKEQHRILNEVLLSGNREDWISSNPPRLQPAENSPFLSWPTSYCAATIFALITIDFLNETTFGRCKRCGSAFERKTKHEKNYCSDPCINAANVLNWRRRRDEAQREAKRYSQDQKLMEAKNATRKGQRQRRDLSA